MPAPDAVDDTVDDVLVDPVRGARDRALDAVDDDVLVEVVEVVLVLEERVAGVRAPVALGEPLERPELLAAEPEERGDADGDAPRATPR